MLKKMRRLLVVLLVVLLLAMTLSTATLVTAYVTDTATDTEQQAHADLPWVPDWKCMAGVGWVIPGVIATATDPPTHGNVFYYLYAQVAFWGTAAWTAWACADSLARYEAARARCTNYYSSSFFDWYWAPTTGWFPFEKERYYSRGPCGVQWFIP